MIYRLNKKFSDDGEIRTPKPKGHYHLKVACLPISPHRQKRLAKLPIISAEKIKEIDGIGIKKMEK